MKILVTGPNKRTREKLAKMLRLATDFSIIVGGGYMTETLMEVPFEKQVSNLIVVGFPETLEQDKIMRQCLFHPDLIIVLNASYEQMESNDLSVKMCEECKTTYNINTLRKLKLGFKCDVCGGILETGDNEEWKNIRIQEYCDYLQNTYPVVEQYKENRGKTVVWEFDEEDGFGEILNNVVDYIKYMIC